MYCKDCGSQIPDGSEICPYCGMSTKITDSHSEHCNNMKSSNQGKTAVPAESLPSAEQTSHIQNNGPELSNIQNREQQSKNTPAKTDVLKAAEKRYRRPSSSVSPTMILGMTAIILIIIAIPLMRILGVEHPISRPKPIAKPTPAVETIDVSENTDNTDSGNELVQSAEMEDIQESVSETPEETQKTAEEDNGNEDSKTRIVIDEEYAAMQWYTYYISYLDAINHGGDVSYLKNPSDARKESFKTNYEKYNKGYMFENLTFDVDKTDMKMKELGNGKIEVTCHAYAVNICTEIANSEITDNRVALLGVLQIDKNTGDFILMEQQSDKNHVFGTDEMIHCVEP